MSPTPSDEPKLQTGQLLHSSAVGIAEPMQTENQAEALSQVLPSEVPSSETSSKQQLALKLDFSRLSSVAETSTSQPHVLFYPLHYEPNYAYPLLVWLHGCGGDERQIMRIMPKLSLRNYVAVAPRGFSVDEWGGLDSQHNGNGEASASANIWNSLDVSSILQEKARQKTQYDWFETESCLSAAEQRIFDCIALTKKQANISSRRVFLAGFGSGGTMALRLGLLYPEAFAGVASLGGVFPQAKNAMNRWTATRDLAVFLGFGQQSDVFSPDEACHTLELLHTAGLPTAAREYPCGQELVPQMLQDLNHWIMNLVCGG